MSYNHPPDKYKIRGQIETSTGGATRCRVCGNGIRKGDRHLATHFYSFMKSKSYRVCESCLELIQEEIKHPTKEDTNNDSEAKFL